ncbi:hypothetical protein Bca4012_036026 [Brassica carinata]
MVFLSLGLVLIQTACLLVSSGIVSVISSSGFSRTCFFSSPSTGFFPTANGKSV